MDDFAVWFACDANGELTGGAGGWVSVLTPQGWKRVAEELPHPDAYEALAVLCVRAHDARLSHCSCDHRDPWWPDAKGPWRIEVPFRVLWPKDED